MGKIAVYEKSITEIGKYALLARDNELAIVLPFTDITSDLEESIKEVFNFQNFKLYGRRDVTQLNLPTANLHFLSYFGRTTIDIAKQLPELSTYLIDTEANQIPAFTHFNRISKDQINQIAQSYIK